MARAVAEAVIYRTAGHGLQIQWGLVWGRSHMGGWLCMSTQWKEGKALSGFTAPVTG